MEMNDGTEKYAHRTKWHQLVESRENYKKFQRDLRKLSEQTTWWQKKCIVDKCWVIYNGRKSLNYLYTLQDLKLTVNTHERELSIILAMLLYSITPVPNYFWWKLHCFIDFKRLWFTQGYDMTQYVQFCSLPLTMQKCKCFRNGQWKNFETWEILSLNRNWTDLICLVKTGNE